MDIVIKTLEGLEEVLAQELEELQLADIKILRRAVSCTGNWAQLYKCNYLLRTAMRVLMPIESFKLNTQEDLYEAVKSIEWSRYIAQGKTFAINGTVSGDLFPSGRFALYRTKDAIVDQLRDKYGERPSINTKSPNILIDVHLNNDELNISLDSSGKSLHLRNYKYRQYKAPLNEVLAAGIIKLSGWDGKKTLHDPMAGSGTLITEALMIAANIPAGKFVQSFGFQKWSEYYKDIWLKVKETADAQIRHPECEIIASDLNSFAVRDIKKNLQKFPFREIVKVYERDFFKVDGSPDKHLVMNPPYDLRVKVENIDEFYQQIGDALKQNWQGSEAWMITTNLNAMKSFGLKPTKKIALHHGGTESKLYKFEIYEGSKKSKYQ
jgi:putative N6-adenine-specific DNA methylase